MPGRELFCDEDVPELVARRLREFGHTVFIPLTLNLTGAPDYQHVQMCARNNWILVTQNRRDFQRLHALWSTLSAWGILPATHGGILTIVKQEREAQEEWASAINDFLQQGEDMRGNMYRWRMFTKRWEMESVAFR